MRYLISGALVLVLAGCSSEKVAGPAPIHSHIAAKASIICPTGYSGVVIRTGFEESEVCMPNGQF